ncbi:TetR/AcrR family transcriptional regulator [Mucilaginibacter jinjuensis]|uniref:TetR/AcrR family transcriptional regulator n=1 Tax=Mucilaginibacter jinjuensis TaxID=1176721 RepID=A0ABY7T9W7_9SPHI|nr:TetR/AcrR family transcriptional regulator [Mucilaginibacter jinjuensis]WCT13295.1 TetR/AcrR family transcriptional regulator [Mucilaginibacter jinjuensis]
MKQSKTDRTRAHIIRTTAAIFNKKGYAGTSIKDITEATKLTSGSIYGNFANKEDVALAALDYNITCFCGVLLKEVNKHKNTRDKLLGFITPFHSSARSPFPVGGCPMVNALKEADDTLERFRKKAGEGMLAWKRELVSIIDQGITEGGFKPDTDAVKIATHIVALCEYGTLMYSATKSIKQADEIIDMAMDVAKSIMLNP